MVVRFFLKSSLVSLHFGFKFQASRFAGNCFLSLPLSIFLSEVRFVYLNSFPPMCPSLVFFHVASNNVPHLHFVFFLLPSLRFFLGVRFRPKLAPAFPSPTHWVHFMTPSVANKLRSVFAPPLVEDGLARFM